MDTSEEPFDGELTGTMPRPRCELRVVCEPAQFEMHMAAKASKAEKEHLARVALWSLPRVELVARCLVLKG